MKKQFVILLAAILLFFWSCGSQKTADPNLASLVDSGNFTFMAQRANPTNYDVMNVMNSMPNAAATRMLNLDRGYTIVLKDGNLSADLPYFGRSYSPSPDPSKNGVKIESGNTPKITKSISKKGNWLYTIEPNDGRVSKIIMEIFKNGKAFVSVDSNDRQPISYEGYITKNSN